MKNKISLIFVCIYLFLYQSITFSYRTTQEVEKGLSNFFYYPESSIIYLNIPKNASTFLRCALIHPYIRLNRASLSENQIKKSIKLLCVRNPYDRVISSYFEILKNRQDGSEETQFKKFYKNRDNLFLSFHQFLLAIKDRIHDGHAYLQSDVLKKQNFLISDLDFITDFQRIESDLMVFSERFGIPVNFTVEKGASPSRGKAKLVQYVKNNKEVKSLIKSIYDKDLIFYKTCQEKRLKLLKIIQSEKAILNKG